MMLTAQQWLTLFGQVCRRFNWICHAYCLMDNHFHIALVNHRRQFERRYALAQRRVRITGLMAASGMCNEGQIPLILTSSSRPDLHRPNSRRITVRVGPWANKYFNITVEQRDVVQQAFAGETAEFVVFQF